MTYSLTITTRARSACLRVAGDLDYQTSDDYFAAANRLLAQHSDLSDLHLDFSALKFLDSAALSGLLILHRRASQANVELHFDRRPPFLDRILHVTGLFSHFDLTHAEADDESNLVRQSGTGDTGVF